MESQQHSSQGSGGSLCRTCFNLDTRALVAVLDSEHDSDDIDVTVDQKELTTKLWRTGRRITGSASAGCQSCLLLLRTVKHFGAGEDILYGEGRISIRFSLCGATPELSFRSSRFLPTFIQLYQDEKAPFPPKTNSVLPLPDKLANHLSGDGIAFIKSCLQRCQAEHASCQQDAPSSLPTRLLDVGTREEGTIRLVNTASMSPAPYITLSYCWGNAVALRTTYDTVDRVRGGVGIAGLPQAYVDAIAMCHELGVRYLWIDALCIIQDSTEDWEKESSKMSATYANSLLTIAAASSSSAVEGFLRRDGSVTAYCNEDQVYADECGIKARRIEESGHHWRWYDEAWNRVPQEPWSRRGWTLQEQLLSTRLLSFTPSEVQWTCRTDVQCECRSRLNHGRQFGGPSHHLSQLANSHEAFLFWHKVIENYSNRLLTKGEDKLPAISGAAEVIAQKTGSGYAAGLWTDFIDQDLLWRRASDDLDTLRAGYVAPSWSWASIEGEVDYYCFRNGKTPYTRSAVVEVETKASSCAPFGRVKGGQLTIHGPLVPALILRIASDGWVKAKFGGPTLEFRADTALEEVSYTEEDGAPQRTVSRHSPESLAQAGEAERAPLQGRWPQGLPCWAVRMGSYAAKSGPGHRDVELLVVGRSPAPPHHYVRIGIATCREEPGDSKIAEMYGAEKTEVIHII